MEVWPENQCCVCVFIDFSLLLIRLCIVVFSCDVKRIFGVEYSDSHRN